MAPCSGKAKCGCGCPKKKKAVKRKAPAKKRAMAFRGSSLPLPPSAIAPAPILSAVSKVSGDNVVKKMTTEIGTQTEKPVAPLVKPTKYSRQQIQQSTMKKEEVIEQPVARYDVSKIRPTSEPYEQRLGVNIPVKMTGQFIKKDTGLFATDTRGNIRKDKLN